MRQTWGAVVVTLDGGGVLTGLPGPRGTTTGTGELQEVEEGPTISTEVEEEGHVGVTAGASITRWWRGTEAERRCYDKGRQEGR